MHSSSSFENRRVLFLSTRETVCRCSFSLPLVFWLMWLWRRERETWKNRIFNHKKSEKDTQDKSKGKRGIWTKEKRKELTSDPSVVTIYFYTTKKRKIANSSATSLVSFVLQLFFCQALLLALESSWSFILPKELVTKATPATRLIFRSKFHFNCLLLELTCHSSLYHLFTGKLCILNFIQVPLHLHSLLSLQFALLVFCKRYCLK